MLREWRARRQAEREALAAAEARRDEALIAEQEAKKDAERVGFLLARNHLSERMRVAFGGDTP